MSDVPTAAPPAGADFDPPPCLRRRGPAEFDLKDERGCRPSLGRGGFHLRSGRRYTVRVRPQPADDFGQVTGAIVEASDCLPAVVPASLVKTASGPEYVSILRPHRPFFLPAKTGLTVTLHHDRWGPFSLTLPVVVWPRLWSQLSLAVAVPVAAAGKRLSDRLAEEGSSVIGVFRGEVQDPTFWLQLLLFGLLAFALLRAFGWCWVTVGARTD